MSVREVVRVVLIVCALCRAPGVTLQFSWYQGPSLVCFCATSGGSTRMKVYLGEARSG